MSHETDTTWESMQSFDETLERLVTMTNQTNLVALDKTLHVVHGAMQSNDWSSTAHRIGNISTRIARAVYEVGLTLPAEQRVGPYREGIEG